MWFIIIVIIAIFAYYTTCFIIEKRCKRKAISMSDEELDIQSSILFDELEERYSLSKCIMYKAMIDELNRRKS